VVEQPGELRKTAPARRTGDVAAVEAAAHLVPERACLARRAVVRRRLAHEVEPLRRARARGVEEIAVASDGVDRGEAGALDPRLEIAPQLVVEERRCLRATRERAFLEAEDEDHFGAPRSR